MPNNSRPVAALAAASAYLGFAALVVYHHESWFDEAQAWLLAADLSVPRLFLHQLRYEGTPGLWHALLFLPAHAHAPYFTVHVIALLIAALGTYVWIRWAPFPGFIRVLVPFSFFLFYQFGVVARSYVLLPLLLFLLARSRRHSDLPLPRYFLLLFLLSQTCVHGLLISAALLSVDLLHIARLTADRRSTALRYLRRPYALIGINYVLIILQLWPPRNLSTPWQRPTNLLLSTVEAGRALSNSLTGNYAFSAIILLVSAAWLFRRRMLLEGVVPTAFVLCLFVFLYHNAWHEGILFLIWLFALWLSCDSFDFRAAATPDRILYAGLLASLTLVVAIHIVWSAKASRDDFRGPYSGSVAAARYIRSHQLDHKSIGAIGYRTTAILPYFATNIFDPGQPRYWPWSATERRDEEVSVLRRAPEYVLYSVPFAPNGQGRRIEAFSEPLLRSYTIVARFPGLLFWKGRAVDTDRFVLMRRR